MHYIFPDGCVKLKGIFYIYFCLQALEAIDVLDCRGYFPIILVCLTPFQIVTPGLVGELKYSDVLLEVL